jgi:hypothetical protein
LFVVTRTITWSPGRSWPPAAAAGLVATLSATSPSGRAGPSSNWARTSGWFG